MTESINPIDIARFMEHGPRAGQRMTKSEWSYVLLNYFDRLIYKGSVRKLIVKDLGYGVVEVRMVATDEEAKP